MSDRTDHQVPRLSQDHLKHSADSDLNSGFAQSPVFPDFPGESKTPFLDYVTTHLPRILFDMRLGEFNARIDTHVSAGRYLEAFILKSLYIESVITVLATAFKYKKKGFDGDKLSVVSEVEKNPAEQKFFKDSMEERLKENIKSLRGLEALSEKQIEYLLTWNDKYRNELFHNVGQLMLMPDGLENKAKGGWDFIQKFVNEPWFKGMEENFHKSEEEIIAKRIAKSGDSDSPTTPLLI